MHSTQNRTVITESIQLLIGLLKPGFPFEREIKLHELQSWVCFSDRDGEMPKDAGTRAAVHFLDRIEQHEKSLRGAPGSAGRLQSLLKIDAYRRLYESEIGSRGGWKYLFQIKPPSEFNAEIKSYEKSARTVTDVMDFRLRAKDHGHESRSNLTHAFVFLRNDPDKPKKPSGSAIKKHWKRQKESAVFVYVSQKTGFRFFPREVGTKQFLEDLTAEARNMDGLKEYFGRCASVAEKFGDEFAWMLECFPNAKQLPRIQLKTEPLSQVEMDRLSNYSEDAAEFKDS
jgi:hypothetical protein